MTPDKLEEPAYLYDGTLEGLLCAVFCSYAFHERPADVLSEEGRAQLRLEQPQRIIETDFDRAERVRKGVVRKAGKTAFERIARASTCPSDKAGYAVYLYIRHIMDTKLPRRLYVEDLSNPVVGSVERLSLTAANEAEKMRQFVRFSRLKNGVWFARCNPSCSVVPLVMGYFAARMNSERFVIYDEAHRMTGIYDGDAWSLAKGEINGALPISPDDFEAELLWQTFYQATSIEARYHPELRSKLMPCRLWKNLPEMKVRGSKPSGR